MLLTDRCILKKFFLFFFYILSTFLFVFFIADVVFILTNYEEVSFTALLKYTFFKHSQTLYQLTPFVSFIASILTIVSMDKNQELFILMSNGMSFTRICLPLLGAVLALSGFIFVLSDQILPLFMKQRNLIYDRDIRKIKKDSTRQPLLSMYPIKDKLWFFYKNTIFSLKSWNQEKQEASHLTLFFLDEDWSLKQVIRANTAYKKQNQWFLYNGNSSSKTKKEDILSNHSFNHKNLTLDNNIYPLYLSSPAPLSHMNMDKIRFNIKQRKGAGLKTQLYKTEYHQRIHFIFMGFILSLFVFPLQAYLQNRKGKSPVYAFVTVLSISFIYLFVNHIGLNMGKKGAMSPFPAVWLSSFLSLSALLLLCYTQQKRSSKWLYWKS